MLTAAVRLFFEMQEKEDVDGYLALWSMKAQRPQTLGLRYIFDNGDDKFSDIAITRVVPSGNRVRACRHSASGRFRPPFPTCRRA